MKEKNRSVEILTIMWKIDKLEDFCAVQPV